MTEDSDLLLFGVSRVLFKMDLKGNGFEIDMNLLSLCDDFNFLRNTKQNQNLTDESSE